MRAPRRTHRAIVIVPAVDHRPALTSACLSRHEEHVASRRGARSFATRRHPGPAGATVPVGPAEVAASSPHRAEAVCLFAPFARCRSNNPGRRHRGRRDEARPRLHNARGGACAPRRRGRPSCPACRRRGPRGDPAWRPPHGAARQPRRRHRVRRHRARCAASRTKEGAFAPGGRRRARDARSARPLPGHGRGVRGASARRAGTSSSVVSEWSTGSPSSDDRAEPAPLTPRALPPLGAWVSNGGALHSYV